MDTFFNFMNRRIRINYALTPKVAAYYVFRCPHCNKTKAVFMPEESNCDFILWSDEKLVRDKYPEISIVQKCQRCGAYYIAEVEKKVEESYGTLNDNSRLSIEELCKVCRDKNFLHSIGPDYKRLVLLQYVQQYNDLYRRHKQKENCAPYAQSKMFIDAILYLTQHPDTSFCLRLDLYRQAGMFRKCAATFPPRHLKLTAEMNEFIETSKYLAGTGNNAPFATYMSCSLLTQRLKFWD